MDDDRRRGMEMMGQSKVCPSFNQPRVRILNSQAQKSVLFLLWSSAAGDLGTLVPFAFLPMVALVGC
jgi:hypothetical protein